MDRKQLFYRRDEQVWVADVRAEGSFYAGKPRLLLEQRGFGWGAARRSWELWPDGKAFVMVLKHGEGRPQPVTEMILVQNWLEELKRLVPVK